MATDSHTQAQAAEIADARERSAGTLRPTVPALEHMLYKAYPILDHGFVRVIDYMGDDSAIVQAARVSYGRGTKRVQEDVGLIRYLMRHRHTTPSLLPPPLSTGSCTNYTFTIGLSAAPGGLAAAARAPPA